MTHFSLHSRPFQMCVLCPNPITTMECFFFKFNDCTFEWILWINYIQWSNVFIFFFGQNKGYNLLGFPIGLFGFSMGLISLTKSLNPCAFLYPYFVLIFNGALGWTEIPLLISRIPMISIFFCLCPCFWY